MATEAGQHMQAGINAICRMHASISRLLVDFDRSLPWAGTSVFGNFATKDLTYHAKARFWMPEGVFRYLSCNTDPKIVAGISVCLIDQRLLEPMLLIGCLRYHEDPIRIKTICDGWDLWNFYFEWNSGWTEGVAKECDIPSDARDRIQAATVISAPLYSIARMNDVRELMEQVGLGGAQAAGASSK